VLRFFFGSNLSLDEEQDDEIDPVPSVRVAPTITVEQSLDIICAGAGIRGHYKEIIRTFTRLKCSCMVGLNKEMGLQKLCIDEHVKMMGKWAPPQPSTRLRTASSTPDADTKRRIDDVRTRLHTVRNKMCEAESKLPGGSTNAEPPNPPLFSRFARPLLKSKGTSPLSKARSACSPEAAAPLRR
jgi:hypothetical protein